MLRLLSRAWLTAQTYSIYAPVSCLVEWYACLYTRNTKQPEQRRTTRRVPRLDLENLSIETRPFGAFPCDPNTLFGDKRLKRIPQFLSSRREA